MVLGSMLLKTWVVKWADYFGGIGHICAWYGFRNPFSIIGTMLVKVQMIMQKRLHRFKSVKILGWVSIVLLVTCYFLVQYIFTGNYEMDFFGGGSKDISSMRVFYANIVGFVELQFLQWNITQD
jgi:K(+)-stimulated pyrophosphate-energized sodium pump